MGVVVDGEAEGAKVEAEVGGGILYEEMPVTVTVALQVEVWKQPTLSVKVGVLRDDPGTV